MICSMAVLVATTSPGAEAAIDFDFNKIADSKTGVAGDIIEDFSHAEGDRIDVSTIDADQRAGHAGNQAFRYIGSDSFAHFHALHPGVIGIIRYANGDVQGNVNATLAPDFEIFVNNIVNPLVAADFVL